MSLVMGSSSIVQISVYLKLEKRNYQLKLHNLSVKSQDKTQAKT
jgi:hypothetical protein